MVEATVANVARMNNFFIVKNALGLLLRSIAMEITGC
jgi:hypothetical protein